MIASHDRSLLAMSIKRNIKFWENAMKRHILYLLPIMIDHDWQSWAKCSSAGLVVPYSSYNMVTFGVMVSNTMISTCTLMHVMNSDSAIRICTFAKMRPQVQQLEQERLWNVKFYTETHSRKQYYMDTAKWPHFVCKLHLKTYMQLYTVACRLA